MKNDDITYADLNGNICHKILVNGQQTAYAQHIISISTSAAFDRISVLEIILSNWLPGEEEYISDTANFPMNAEIEVWVGYDEPSHKIFKGYINEMTVSDLCAILTIKARHAADRMDDVRKLRSFENMSDDEIVNDICDEYGIEYDNTGNPAANKHLGLMQYNCTDWDFINMRAEASGRMVLTTPEGITVKKICTRKDLESKAALDIINGYNVHGINAEVNTKYAHRTYQGEAYNTSEQDTENSTSSEGQASQSEENKAADEQRTLLSMSSQEDAYDLEAYVDAYSLRNDLAFLKGKLEIIGYAPLAPGDIVRLCKMSKGFNGKVMVSSVVHAISAGKWSTHLDIGYEITSYIERHPDVVAPSSMGSLPGVNGLQIAKVEALKGENGDPFGEEKICVRLMNASRAKIWARVATLDAGDMRGSFFLPEINDEVIVGFVDNNPTQAVILGMMHSSKARPPLEITDENHVKGFFSRENIQLLFDDEKKALSIITPGNNRLIMSDEEKGIVLEDQHGNTVVMNDQGITVESQKALTIKTAQDINMEANNINIKAKAELKAQGTSAAEFSSAGNTVLKGGIVQIN